MSSQYIVEYAGLPLRFNGHQATSVPEHEATVFTAEADGWLAAHHAALPPRKLRVINLYVRNTTH